MEYANKAMAIGEKLGYKETIAINLNNIAEAYFDSDKVLLKLLENVEMPSSI